MNSGLLVSNDLAHSLRLCWQHLRLTSTQMKAVPLEALIIKIPHITNQEHGSLERLNDINLIAETEK